MEFLVEKLHYPWFCRESPPIRELQIKLCHKKHCKWVRVNFPAFLNNLNVCIHNLYAHFAIKVKYIVPISTVYISPSFLMRLSFAMLHGIVVISIYTFVFLANFQILFCFKPKILKLSKNAVINLVACSWLITKTFNYYGKNDSDEYSQNQ